MRVGFLDFIWDMIFVVEDWGFLVLGGVIFLVFGVVCFVNWIVGWIEGVLFCWFMFEVFVGSIFIVFVIEILVDFMVWIGIFDVFFRLVVLMFDIDVLGLICWRFVFFFGLSVGIVGRFCVLILLCLDFNIGIFKLLFWIVDIFWGEVLCGDCWDDFLVIMVVCWEFGDLFWLVLLIFVVVLEGDGELGILIFGILELFFVGRRVVVYLFVVVFEGVDLRRGIVG